MEKQTELRSTWKQTIIPRDAAHEKFKVRGQQAVNTTQAQHLNSLLRQKYQ